MFRSLLLIVFMGISTHFLSAQGGAKVFVGTTIVNQDFLDTENQFIGWNLGLSARLGAGVFFFAPELYYINTNVVPMDSMNPFEKTARKQTLKIPLGIGMKFKTAQKQRIFFKGGVIGSYLMIMDDNATYDFTDINDIYGGYYGSIGYDLRWFTLEYRYEQSLSNNFHKIENSGLTFHNIMMGVNF